MEIVSKGYLFLFIEQGQRKVSIDTLYRLAEIYDCTMEDLITENPEAGE